MVFQFNTTRLLRSVGFAAISIWSLMLFRPYPHMVGYIVFLAPAAMGGAIGALFGKTPHGVFGGLVFAVIALVALFIFIVLAGPFID
jgi:hypothetical protein